MKGIKVDVKTGKQELVDDGLPMPESPPMPEPKRIDFEKLKEVLLKAGIIKDKSEVE